MEILWYIDGHHHLLSERSTVSVPSVFKQFQGYNKPELSKHRKRSQSNLSSITLEHHARILATCLQAAYWDTPSWKQFKTDVAQLAEPLTGYVPHMAKKRKVVTENQRSETPVRSISENIQLYYLPVADTTTLSLTPLSSVIEGKQEYEHVFVNDFVPSEPLPKNCSIVTLGCILCGHVAVITKPSPHYIYKPCPPIPARDVAMIPCRPLLIFLHSCKIKSGIGLGTRLSFGCLTGLLLTHWAMKVE